MNAKNPTLALQIQQALQSLSPLHLELINESDMHRGPPNRESHFKLFIVSESFHGKSRIQRQQEVYQILDFAFKAGLHALSLRTLSPQEYSQQAGISFQSPACSHKK